MSTPTPNDLIGTVIGNYSIEARLGSGGMGQIYQGVHLHVERPVAIKVLHAHLADNPDFQARFLREARAVARLDHPNIVRLYDFGEEHGRFYLVMELLPDGSLRSLLRRRSDPDAEWSLRVGIDLVNQAAGALAYAHEQGMVHRDIKPDNLLLKDRGAVTHGPRFIVKVADFGLARLAEGNVGTASGVLLGTPGYMSPEQCQGQRLDGRSDIYSLGIVLYEIATGRQPFESKSPSDAIFQHVYVAPPAPRSIRPDLPTRVEEIIQRCLAKRPDDRYASMAEFSAELRVLLDAEPPLLEGAGAADAEHGIDGTELPILAPSPSPMIAQSSPGSRQPSISGATIPRVLVIDASGEVLHSVDISGDGLAVGRLPDNDLVLPDSNISRHHLTLDWDGTQVIVTDLGSRGGTFLGGLPIPPHTGRPWPADADLHIGAARLRLVLPEDRSVAVAPSAVAAVPPANAAPTATRESSVAVTPEPDQPAAPPPFELAGNERRRIPLAALGLLLLVPIAVVAYLLLGRDGGSDASNQTQPAGAGVTATPRSATVTSTPEAGTTVPSTALAAVPTSTAVAEATNVAATPSAAPSAVATPTTPGVSATATSGSIAAVPTATPLVAPTTLQMTTPGQDGNVMFEARAGQWVSVLVTDVTIGEESSFSTYVSLLAPDGTWLAGTYVSPGSGLIGATEIPTDGTYSVTVDPEGTLTGDATVAIFDATPATASAALDGEPVNVAIAAPGQVANVTFDAEPGQHVSMEFSEASIGESGSLTTYVYVVSEDDVSVASTYIGPPGGYLDTFELTAGGHYSLVIDPDGVLTGNVTIRLHDIPIVASTIEPGGAPVSVQLTIPGQYADLTFEGTTGQRISVELKDVTVGDAASGVSVYIDIIGPDGASVWSTWVGVDGGFIDATELPAVGTYTIRVDPEQLYTGAVTVVVYDVPA